MLTLFDDKKIICFNPSFTGIYQVGKFKPIFTDKGIVLMVTGGPSLIKAWLNDDKAKINYFKSLNVKYVNQFKSILLTPFNDLLYTRFNNDRKSLGFEIIDVTPIEGIGHVADGHEIGNVVNTLTRIHDNLDDIVKVIPQHVEVPNDYYTFNRMDLLKQWSKWMEKRNE